MEKKYPVITLSGSTKFKEEFEKVAKSLTIRGNVVLMPKLFSGYSKEDADIYEACRNINADFDKMIVELHLQKIDMSDKIYVINPGGYIGKSTWDEINYAKAHNKEILYLEKPEKD